MTKKIGTLKELNVKPGDVVRNLLAKKHYEIRVDHDGDCCTWDIEHGIWAIKVKDSYQKYEIVSRASDTPKLWRDMTPEEKGALLLAHHEEKVIEYFSRIDNVWGKTYAPDWRDNYAYRIKPEPKVETVTMYGSPVKHIQWCLDQCALDTHRITFNLIDGEPDCTSIKMEKLQ